MCEKLKCYPDLWSLHEWSNWLTPTYFTTKRYDTIFYIACIPLIPYSNYDTIEMENIKVRYFFGYKLRLQYYYQQVAIKFYIQWDTPNNICAATDMMMPPPQHYEISRIVKFECLENLLDFAIERSKLGVELYLPV